MTKLHSKGSATLVLLAAVAGASAQTAVSSSINLAALADHNTGDATPAKLDTYAASQTTTLNALGGSVLATDTSATGGNSVSGRATANASWTNAGQGSLLLRNFGFTIATSTAYKVAVAGAQTSLPVFTYTFLATSSGTFALNYNVTATGDKFGLQGIYVDWSGPGGGSSYQNASDPTASGLFSRTIAAGTQYTVGILAGPNLLSAGGGQASGSFNADINFQVNPVPEPATFAALGVGLLALRRRRKA